MGLEPTTIPVTGEYSDQLNYYRIILARLTGLEPAIFPVTREYPTN